MSALEKITILDMGQHISGPIAATLLAAMGARVIKLEVPGRGDGSRIGPPYMGAEGVTFRAGVADNIALSFLKRNRNKESITADVTTPLGKQVFTRLVQRVDVLIENFKPGTLERWGFSYDRLHQLNPALIICSVTGFGLSGPYRDWLAYDTVIQAFSGTMFHTGSPDTPPLKSGLTAADSVGALYATIGILAALEHRQITGEGQVVEVPLLDCLVSLVWDEPYDYYERIGMEPRSGNRLSRATPWNLYSASDGHVFICALTDAQWRKISETVNPALAEKYMDMPTRIEHNAEIDAAITTWTSSREKMEIARFFQSKGVPSAPVLSATEVAKDPHVQQRNILRPIEHPELGEVPSVLAWQFPLRFSRSPITPLTHVAPKLGQHNTSVYQWLGLTEAEVNALEGRDNG